MNLAEDLGMIKKDKFLNRCKSFKKLCLVLREKGIRREMIAVFLKLKFYIFNQTM